MKMKILTATCLPIVFCLILMKPDVTRADDDEICYTDTCNKTAEIYSVSMDRSADPCNDYYSHICGHLDDNNNNNNNNNEPKLMDKYGSVDAYLIMNIEELALNFISKIERNDSVNLNRLKTYFASCLNSSESVDRETFSNILSKLGFDMELEAPYWNQTSAQFDWINTTKILLDSSEFGQFLLNVETQRNWLDYPHRLIVLRLTNNFIDIWEKSWTVRDNDILKNSAGQSEKYETLKEVMEFARKLGFISNKRERDQRVTTTIQYLSIIAPSIPWLAYIQTIVGSLTNNTVDENTRIIIPSVGFIQEFENVINDTPGHVILNYIAYAMHITYLLENLRMNEHDYLRSNCLHGNPLTDIIPMILMEALTAEEKSKREYILNLAEGIRQEFLDVINHEWHWMDREVKVQVIKEIESTPVVVAYKNISADMERILHYYDDLKFTGPGIWSVNLQLSKFRLRHELEGMINVQEAHLMNEFPKSVIKQQNVPYFETYKNPTYYFKDNYAESAKMIYITPAGLRHYDVLNQPEYLNLVTIGWKIAEIMVDRCIIPNIYDYHLKQMLLSESSIKHYRETMSCLEDQFWDSSLEVNPEPTSAMHKLLRLNLGLEIVHRLYRKRLNSTETLHQWKLPNFNESVDQMFFISAGFQQCQHDKRDIISARYILETLGRNRQEFGKAFSCEEGTKMNPEKRCQL